MSVESYFWICPVCGNNNSDSVKICVCGNKSYSVRDMFPSINTNLKDKINKIFGKPKGESPMVKFITYGPKERIEIEVYDEDKKVAEYCLNDVKMTQIAYEECKKVENCFGPRIFKNSVAIIRTRKGNTVGCHMVSTYNYRKLQPRKFVYDEYVGASFEITESVGGTVVILVNDFLSCSGFSFTNTIRFENVTGIEIMSEHDK